MPVRFAFTLTMAVMGWGMLCGCQSNQKGQGAMKFADDVQFLKSRTQVVVLSDSSGKAKVAVAPALQGRVMTSTAGGEGGSSFGWINRKYFDDAAAGNTNPHISPYGGEDRFWIGPEGGQFSIFFAKGDEFDYDHWQTPKFIDVEPFETVSVSSDNARFRRSVKIANYSGTPFDIRIDRTVRLLDANEAWQKLSVEPMKDVKLVAFETENSITNTGPADWSKTSGLLSIWILGMFNASPRTTVVIPIQSGPESQVGKQVNDDYFGKVPPDRLKVIDNIVYFKADANFRSKIGIPPRRAQPIMGSYDAANHVLTIVQFTFNLDAKDYVNSAWKIQENPFGGDVANSYNDGPPPTGKPQLGKFYELESSSAAGELSRGQSMRHVHRTIHLQGDEDDLDKIAKATLGVDFKAIEKALKK
jgi:hypothetical protein